MDATQIRFSSFRTEMLPTLWCLRDNIWNVHPIYWWIGNCWHMFSGTIDQGIVSVKTTVQSCIHRQRPKEWWSWGCLRLLPRLPAILEVFLRRCCDHTLLEVRLTGHIPCRLRGRGSQRTLWNQLWNKHTKKFQWLSMHCSSQKLCFWDEVNCIDSSSMCMDMIIITILIENYYNNKKTLMIKTIIIISVQFETSTAASTEI